VIKFLTVVARNLVGLKPVCMCVRACVCSSADGCSPDDNNQQDAGNVGNALPSPPPTPPPNGDGPLSGPNSPVVVANPEYFDDLMPDSGSAIVVGGLVAATAQETRPLRLRSESTESTASDHDEYDRLNGSSSSSSAGGGGAGGAGTGVGSGCAVPLSSVRMPIVGKLSSNGTATVVVSAGLPHVFTESVL
jgi:hypothetical protein